MDKDRDRLLDRVAEIDRKLKEEKAEKDRLNVCLEVRLQKQCVVTLVVKQLRL